VLGDSNYSLRYASIKNIVPFINYINDKSDPLIKNNILIDYKSMGIYLINSDSYNVMFNPLYFTENAYDLLLHSSSLSYDYIILHIDNKPINSIGWNIYKPVNKYIDNINNNTTLNRIYCDSTTIILKT
jgi:hypothetical protein